LNWALLVQQVITALVPILPTILCFVGKSTIKKPAARSLLAWVSAPGIKTPAEYEQQAFL
jgi:hypothetical protein